MADHRMRFGGAERWRREDDVLITGRARFTDDVNLDGQAHAVFVRAPVGHAELRGIDTGAARAMPGVLGVFSGAEVAADGLGGIPPASAFAGQGGRPMVAAPIPVLATGRVRHVGEAVAIVVAKTPQQALDAAERVELDLEQLPAAADVVRALQPEAPAIWPDAPDNLALDWADGDEAAIEAAFAEAAHVARVRLRDTEGGAERARAARRDRRLGSGRGPLYADRRDAGRGDGAPAARRPRVRRAAATDPGADPRRRRRLRHEGPDLPRVRRPALRRAQGRPAGEVDGKPAGKLPFRHPWPRRPAGGRAGARREGPLSGPAGRHRGRYRRLRLHVRGDLRDDEHQELPVQRLQGPGDPDRRADGVHQRGAARPLSRRRPAGGDLPDRAADRRGRPPERHRPHRAAPAQPDPGRRDAVCGGERAGLRQRRVRGGHGPGAGARRLAGLSRPARCRRGGRPAARHRPVLLLGGRGRHPRGDARTCASRRAAASRSGSARRPWARATSAPSRR